MIWYILRSNDESFKTLFMTTLSITFKKFSIDRALSASSTYNGKTFKDLITDEDSISVTKVAECLDPSFDTEQLDGDITWHFEEFYQHNPIATSISVKNLKENEEEETLIFDANWLFEDFQAKDHDDFRNTLQSWKSDMRYACQCKREILVNYGLRNNRYSKPIVLIEFD